MSEQTASLPTGFLHPIKGLDHLVAMVGVGVLSAALGGSAIWRLPLSFVVALAIGGATGFAGYGVVAVESLIVVSIILLGIFTIQSKRPAVQHLALPAVVLFGFVHGNAHGLELPLAASPALFTLGFVLASALCHVVGVGIGLLSRRLEPAAVGFPVLVFGLYLFGQAVAA